MAQFLAYYTGVTDMSGYAYVNADSSGGSTRIEKGTTVHLVANYAETESHNRYHITSPVNGWLHKDYIKQITPVYEYTAPGVVSFSFPASGAVSGSTNPVVCVKTPSSTNATLYRRVDSGSWAYLRSGLYSAVTIYDRLSLTSGSHTIQYKLTEDGLDGAVVSRSITVNPVAWSRDIVIGSVISNENISHRKDINEMLSAVNRQRTYYGLATIVLPGTVGRFEDWKPQMVKMAEAVNECLTKANQTKITVNPGSWPDAATINTIRTGSKKA